MGKLSEAPTVNNISSETCIYIERDGAVSRANASLLGGDTTVLGILMKIINDLQNN